jgi:hypothetical protein
MLIITLRNISDTDDVADYDWHVYVNKNEIANGIVMSHVRAEGWRGLLSKLIAQPEEGWDKDDYRD